MRPSLPSIVVTAAVIEQDGRFLVTLRPEGTHLAGHWEFPGGKCEPGEGPKDCLVREIREELDATIEVGREIHRTSHAYGDRGVELRFFECRLLDAPRLRQVADMRWASPEELRSLSFPPADAELIDLLAGRPTVPASAARSQSAPATAPPTATASRPAPDGRGPVK